MSDGHEDLYQVDTEDGADYQPRAVLEFLRGRDDGLEVSWSREEGRHMAQPKVARWENCREQGYVVSMKNLDRKKQINVAFFQHRVGDNICAVEWLQVTEDPPTINSAEFGDAYKDSGDVTKSMRYGEVLEMALWISDRLEKFWTENMG